MKISTGLSFVALTVIPNFSFAQIAGSSNGGQFEDLLLNIMQFINEILIPFIIAIGFLFFVWGMFRYFIFGGADEESREKGKSLMIHATLGFVMIIIFFGVVNLITSSIGLEGKTIENIPKIPTITP